MPPPYDFSKKLFLYFWNTLRLHLKLMPVSSHAVSGPWLLSPPPPPHGFESGRTQVKKYWKVPKVKTSLLCPESSQWLVVDDRASSSGLWVRTPIHLKLNKYHFFNQMPWGSLRRTVDLIIYIFEDGLRSRKSEEGYKKDTIRCDALGAEGRINFHKPYFLFYPSVERFYERSQEKLWKNTKIHFFTLI